MFGKKNKDQKQLIEFYPWTEDVFQIVDGPVSAIKNVPDFWKKMPKYHRGDELTLGPLDNKSVNASLKHCMVYLDALTGGYHYVTWCDIVVKNVRGIPQLTWRPDTLSPLAVRHVEQYPTPSGHYNAHFSWNMHWGVKTPKGWSTLFTHPLNRTDLPFTTVSGIMDTDQYWGAGNVTFHIKEGFEGIIPAGTPYMHVLPVKRAEWESKVNKDLQQSAHWAMERKKKYIVGYYKKHLWVPKRYR